MTGAAGAVKAAGAEAGSAPERPAPLRLARLHLRMGSLPLARAELEALAGHSMLDEDAMLDLAEVRWRTGDLAGAGEAANALLGRGREDALALVIAAESVAAVGRPGEARRLAARALEAAGGSLDQLFAGMPRSSIWPAELVPTPEPGADEAAGPTGSRGARRTRRRAAVAGGAAGQVATTRPAAVSQLAEDEAPPPASTGAAESFAGGRAALGAGDTSGAAVRLGVALRLEPGYARDVLEAIGDRDDPALALVAGDALRLLGREAEALAAFDRARGHPRQDGNANAVDPGQDPEEDEPG